MMLRESVDEVKTPPFDLERIRKDFPILSQQVYGKELAYFDNAATTQKPESVIRTLQEYYNSYNANIHRGVHFLSQKASQAYDDVRVKLAGFINAKSEREIIFTRGTTESINLIAATFGRKHLSKGDEVVLSAMEHHSNIVPWQIICAEKGASIRIIPMNDAGELILEDLDSLLNSKTKIVSVVHTSNSLGTINPVKEIIQRAHLKNIPVLLDVAQAMVHEAVDVQELDCDFMAFSGHKMLGPTGVGVLYGKFDLLDALPPYQGGGEMIQSVSFEKTTYNEVPFRFEAGTPNIADVIGLGAAIDYLNQLDRKSCLAREQHLLNYATEKMNTIPGVRIIGTAKNKSSVLSFVVEGINALDLGMYLDTKGIAVRTGHHCTEPVMDRLKIPGTLRASFLFYNSLEEIDRMYEAVINGIKLLRK